MDPTIGLILSLVGLILWNLHQNFQIQELKEETNLLWKIVNNPMPGMDYSEIPCSGIFSESQNEEGEV